jgi:hypothetical protein
MEEVVVELNKLIDSPIEDTINFLSGFTLGQLKSISNGVKLKYSEVELVKDQILNFKQLKEVTKEDLEKANVVAENLYIALQKIEDINNVIEELIKVRENQC